MGEDAKQIIREKMKDEPEVIVELLLSHIQELENRIGAAFAMCNKLTAQFQEHQHTDNGMVMVSLRAYMTLAEGAQFGLGKMVKSNPLEQIAHRLRYGNGLGETKGPAGMEVQTKANRSR